MMAHHFIDHSDSPRTPPKATNWAALYGPPLIRSPDGILPISVGILRTRVNHFMTIGASLMLGLSYSAVR